MYGQHSSSVVIGSLLGGDQLRKLGITLKNPERGLGVTNRFSKHELYICLPLSCLLYCLGWIKSDSNFCSSR